MRLLYCYTDFLNDEGVHQAFRGLDEINLNLSTELVFSYDKNENVLSWRRRSEPLPEGFWANAKAQQIKAEGKAGCGETVSLPLDELSTNIYNINVVAGMNGSGKSTVINYVIDLLDHVFREFGKIEDSTPQSARFKVETNRNILVFDVADPPKGRKTEASYNSLYVVDLIPENQQDKKRVGVRENDEPFKTFVISNRGENNKAEEKRLFSRIRALKGIYMTNALTQRDFERNNSRDSERRRDRFFYDCSMGSYVAGGVAQYFPFEVYKQVKYLFDKDQVKLRRELDGCIDEEFVMPRKLRIWPRIDLLRESSKGSSSKAETSDADHSQDRPKSLDDLPLLLGELCVAANASNNDRILGKIKNPVLKEIYRPLGPAYHPNAPDRLFDDLLYGLESNKKSTINIFLQGDLANLNLSCAAPLANGLIVSGSHDETLRIWDPNTGECIRTLEGHSGPVTCVAVLSDGRIVSGSWDKTLRIWDSNTGECIRTLEGHSGPVTCVAVLSDRRIVSGSWDKALRIWNQNTGECIRTLEGHSNVITCVALLPDGRIVSGSFDMTHRIWDPNTGECLKTLEGLPYLVSCFAVLNDGRIVSGSNDGTLCIWDPSTGERLRTLKGHSSAVSCVAVLKDGCIVSGSRDGTLRIWNPDKGECLKTLDGRSGWIAYIAVLPNGSIVSGSGAGILRIWNPDTGKCYNALRGYSYRVNCVSELPSGRIVSGLEDGTLRIWDPDKGECFKTLKGHSDRINCVGLLPKGHIISGSNDGTLRIWDPDEEKCIKTLEANSDIITCVAILPDDLIVSGSFDGALRIWDLKTEKCIKTLEGHSDVITCVALLPDGRIVSGSFDMTLRIWDPNTGECLKTLEGHSDVITCVAVLKDSRIVSGSYDGALRIWNSNTGECNNELWGYFDRITCVVSLPDGRIVSGSNDGTLCIWDPGKEQRIQFINKTLRGHSCRITCVALLPDGRIVSGSTDGTILIWDAKTYEETCVYDKVITLDERIGFVYDLTKKCINFIIYLRNNIDFFRSGKEKSKSFSNTDPEKSGYETDVHSGNKKDQEHPSFCLIDPARGGYEIDIRAEDESKQAELAKFMTEFVEKYRHTCEPEYFIDFDWGLSSGEENMLRLFSNLYHIFDSDYSSGKYGERKIYNKDLKSDDPDDPGTLCDSVLLFMDEADLTLHPEWQRRLIHVLTAFIPKIYPKSCVKDVQIVLSTHSPLLLGDIPRENICFLKGSNNAGDIAGESEETFGQNIHSILKDSFFLSNGTVGEFAASRINHIAARLGEISKFWHDSTKEQEGQASDNGDNDESKRENMRKEHEQELDVIRKTIDLVADGILRVRLESLWMEAVAALNEETETETVIELLKSSKKLSLGEKLYLLNRLSREVDK